MKKKTATAPVEWLSKKATWQEINDPQFTYKIVDFYTKFKFKNIEASVGDFVLISNADAADPDTVEGCDVGQITKLYESHDMDLSDRYRAHVLWFCKVNDIPVNCLKDVDVTLDDSFEVIEDHRPFDKDVSIETFFKQCNIMKMPTTAFIPQSVKSQSFKIPTFVCRFQLDTMGKRKFVLQPVLEDERSDYIANISSPLRTPKSKAKENVTLNKTPNSLIKKLAASSLNDNRSWSVKKADASKLVLMRDITNNYSMSPSERLKEKYKRKSTMNFDDVSPTKISSGQAYNSKISDADISRLLESDDESCTKDKLSLSAKRVLSFDNNKKSSRKSHIPDDVDDINKTPSRRTGRIIKQNTKYDDDFFSDKEIKTNHTPSKSSRRASVATTPKRTKPVTPSSGSDSDEEFLNKTPKRGRKKTKAVATPKTPKTPVNRKVKTSQLTPSIHARQNPVVLKDGGLQKARESLHVSAVPLSLPCREEEFNNIYSFIQGKLNDNSGGCMYISGVPGTGKTATVTEVVRCLNKQVKHEELPKFEFIEINGMRLTEPRQAYVHIYRQLTGKTVAWEQACNLLEARFTKPAPRRSTTVLLIDELDVLCNRRQDVLYNLLDWPTHSAAHLVVVAIANTMDLPERLLMGRVASRLGLTRLTFQPYTFIQLQNIVSARLADTGAFNSDAVQLVARKVAAVSGDARRALDICRRAVELAEVGEGKQVGLVQVNQALSEMIASPKVQAIKSCSKMEQFFLQATVAEVQRTGVEETTFEMIHKQLEAICAFGGFKSPSITEAFGICSRLGSCRLIIAEHSRSDIYQKVLLNVSLDDVHYATQSLGII